jgi:hypothetical protein
MKYEKSIGDEYDTSLLVISAGHLVISTGHLSASGACMIMNRCKKCIRKHGVIRTGYAVIQK